MPATTEPVSPHPEGTEPTPTGPQAPEPLAGEPAGERLQKVLARAGLGSRRVCEELIEDERVRVNGTTAVLGTRVDVESDVVEVDGVPLGVRPDLVLSSPLVRARETAEIIADALGVAVGVTLSDQLAPDGSPAGVLDEILSHGRPRHVVIAGHMPGVSQFGGYLIHHDPDAGFGFQTGAVARIELPDDALLPGTGRLRWMIPPSVATRLLTE